MNTTLKIEKQNDLSFRDGGGDSTLPFSRDEEKE